MHILKGCVHHLFNFALNVVFVFGCEVTLSSPYQNTTLLPQDSSVVAFCTTSLATQERLFWSIFVANVNTDNAATFANDDSLLHSNGFFLGQTTSTPNSETTIQLIINETNRNNESRIQCTKSGSSARDAISETVFFVYEPRPVVITDEDVNVHKINISWTLPESVYDRIRWAYILTIESYSFSDSFSWQDLFYVFNVDNNAPPCEVYNFSVTATPVGATYTGDGCSVPSPVLSRMLPSLPDIERLESYLNNNYYSLTNGPLTGFKLSVNILGADSCPRYPVTAYILQVEESAAPNDIVYISSTMNTSLSVSNLQQDRMLLFHITVSNSVGNVSTEKRTIYTTDVQNITAEPINGVNAFMVWCTFVNSSEAMGCRILLLGRFDNTTVHLTKDGSNTAEAIVNISYPVSCYTGVLGYDIESDGSIGTLAVPGLLVLTNTSIDMKCNPPVEHAPPNQAIPVIVGSVLAVIITLVFLLTSLFTFLIKCKRSHTKIGVVDCSNHSSTRESESAPNTYNEDADSDKAMPVYDKPHLKQDVSMRIAGDGADHSNQYNSTTHTQELSPDKASDVDKCAAMYAELRDEPEHVYYVLEPDRPPRGVEAPPPADDILPDEDAPPLPPPYNPLQEVYIGINDLMPGEQ